MMYKIFGEMYNSFAKLNSSVPWNEVEFEVSTCRYRDLLKESSRYGSVPAPFVLTVLGITVVENRELPCNKVRLYQKKRVLVEEKVV